MKRSDKKIIHQYLDGTIERKALEPLQQKSSEAGEYADALQKLISYSASFEVPAVRSGLSDRLDNLAATCNIIETEPPASAFSMIFKPITIRISPAMVAMSAILLIAAVSLPVSFLFGDLIQRNNELTINNAAISLEGEQPTRAAFGAASVEVGEATFIYRDESAASVALVGDFNNWNPNATPLVETARGLWTVNLELKKGTYEYLFVVDGVFKTDPRANNFHDDGFGNVNAVLEL